MKTHVLISILVLTIVFSTSHVTFADSAPDLPACSLDYKYVPVEGEKYVDAKTVKPTCKAIKITLTFSNSKEFMNKILLLDKIYNINEISNPDDGGHSYRIHDSALYVGKHSRTPEIFAINKVYVNSKGGLEGVFTEKKTKKKNEYDEVYTKMKARNKKEFLGNLFPVVLFTSDKDFVKYGIYLEMYFPDVKRGAYEEEFFMRQKNKKFTNFPVAHYPYDVVPVISPIEAKEFIYTPLGFVKDEGIYKVVAYKEKEIWTLDNGSKRTKTFKPPFVKGLQKNVPGFKK